MENAVKSEELLVSTSRAEFGSGAYVDRLRLYEAERGPMEAMTRMMAEAGKYGVSLGRLTPEEINGFNEFLGQTMKKLGPGALTRELHYFRNKLNIAPPTLDSLIKLNFGLPEEKKWILLTPLRSMYHMHGKDGIYNLKFVSADGHFEAVYDKQGDLLTEENGPVNMGTYNYFSPFSGELHNRYDVEPYFRWGNTAASGAEGFIGENAKGLANFERWDLSTFAKLRFWNTMLRANPGELFNHFGKRFRNKGI